MPRRANRSCILTCFALEMLELREYCFAQQNYTGSYLPFNINGSEDLG